MDEATLLIEQIVKLSPSAFMGIFLLLIIYAGIKMIEKSGPLVKRISEVIEASTKSWESITERQAENNRELVDNHKEHYEFLVNGLNKKMEELNEKNQAQDEEIRMLKAERDEKNEILATQGKRMVAMQCEIDALRTDGTAKDEQIAQLKAELKEVKADRSQVAKERDELAARIDALENKKGGDKKDGK